MSHVRRLGSRTSWARRGIATTAALATAYLVTDRLTDHSITRSLRTMRAFAHIVYLYKYTYPSSLAEYAALHRRSAEIILQLCLINEGLYIKMGQALNAMSHILPHEYTDTLKVLLDRAPSVPLEDIRAVVRAETGQELEELFDDFDPVPVASASIAQVHRARLKAEGSPGLSCSDDVCAGEWVAVKVQKPHIRTQSKWDLRTYRLISVLIQALFGLPTQWSRQTIVDALQREMDFTLEAANARRVRALFRDDAHIYVPREYTPYTTTRLLVMEWIDGVKLLDVRAVRAEFDSTAILRTIFDAFGKMIFEYGFVHCDLHPANILVRHCRSEGSAGQTESAPSMLSSVHHGRPTSMDRSSAVFCPATREAPLKHGQAARRGASSWWARYVPMGHAHRTDFQVVLLDFGLCVSETERFRMQYALLYRSIFTHDMATLSRILDGWGVNDAETFVSIQMQKPLQSIQAGRYDEVTREEMRTIQRAARDRARHLLRDGALIPRELPMVGRGVDILRGVNRLYGSPVNRLNMFVTSAVRCLGPLHDYDGVTRYLDRLRERATRPRIASGARAQEDDAVASAHHRGKDTHGHDSNSDSVRKGLLAVTCVEESFVSAYDGDAEAFRAAQSAAARELMEEERASTVLVVRHAIQSLRQRLYFYSILTALAVMHTMTLWYNAVLSMLPLPVHVRQRLRARAVEERIDRRLNAIDDEQE